MIPLLREICRNEVRKPDEEVDLVHGRKYHPTVNDKAISLTDPDATLVTADGKSLPRYKNHRVVDNANGVTTTLGTTSGSVNEDGAMMEPIKQTVCSRRTEYFGNSP